MYPIIEEQSCINSFQLVVIPSASRLYQLYGPMFRALSASDKAPIDVNAGVSKLNDLREASNLDDYNSYAEAMAKDSSETSSN